MNRLTPARLSMVMFMVVGGLIAAYITKGLLAVEEKKAATPSLRNIPMAVADLPVATMITEAHLGLGPAQPSKITRDVLLSNKSIIGRITKEPITAAEPIHSSMLYQKGDYPPLKVSEGMQAVTIVLSASAIVDGLVKPGQFVDVHFSPMSMANDPRMNGGMSMTLFKGVKIITINRLATQGITGSDSNSITLELSSEQANIVLVAKDHGRLYFSFNPDGKGSGGLALTGKDRATLEEILGLQPIPKPPAPPASFVTQIYRGLNRRQFEFRQVGNRMMEYGGGAVNVVVPQGQNGPGGTAPNEPPLQQPGAQDNGAGNNGAGAPPAAGYDPGVPAPPSAGIPQGPAGQQGQANPPFPPQPAASTEKLF